MKYSNIVHKVGRGGAALGGSFLVAVVLLMALNIIFRFWNAVIPGTFELVELMIIVTISFALGYSAMMHGHVSLRFLTSRISARASAILECLNSAISIAFYGAIAWGSTALAVRRLQLGEQSELLDIPYFPFRVVWIFGLIFLCSVVLIDMINAFRTAVRK